MARICAFVVVTVPWNMAMSLSLFLPLILLVAFTRLPCSEASHFRGGIIYWKPNPDSPLKVFVHLSHCIRQFTDSRSRPRYFHSETHRFGITLCYFCWSRLWYWKIHQLWLFSVSVEFRMISFHWSCMNWLMHVIKRFLIIEDETT